MQPCGPDPPGRGWQRALSPGFYIPVHLQASLRGNLPRPSSLFVHKATEGGELGEVFRREALAVGAESGSWLKWPAVQSPARLPRTWGSATTASSVGTVGGATPQQHVWLGSWVMVSGGRERAEGTEKNLKGLSFSWPKQLKRRCGKMGTSFPERPTVALGRARHARPHLDSVSGVTVGLPRETRE